MWITIIMAIFSYIIPLNENMNHQSNHLTTKDGYFKENHLENKFEQDKILIYQESWVLKLECLQCHERFERWSKEKNQSANVITKEKDEEEKEGIGKEKENGKEDLDILWKKLDVDVVEIKETENKNYEREKMKEWMRERMEDNEWLREWMDGIVG